jgi:hypothetical protein
MKVTTSRVPRYDTWCWRRNLRRGVASAELALLLPLLIFFGLSVTDYARVCYYGVILDGCARNGAWYGRLGTYDPASPYSSLQAAALADSTANSFSPQPSFDVKYSMSPNGPYTLTTYTAPGYVQVTVSWTFTTLIAYPGIPNQVNIKRVARMSVPATYPVLD